MRQGKGESLLLLYQRPRFCCKSSLLLKLSIMLYKAPFSGISNPCNEAPNSGRTEMIVPVALSCKRRIDNSFSVMRLVEKLIFQNYGKKITACIRATVQ